MMGTPTKRYDICAGRPYGDDGKKQWIRVGRLTEWDEGGPSIELFAVPTGSWFDGKLSCFDPEGKKEEGSQRPQRRSSVSADSEDAPPF